MEDRFLIGLDFGTLSARGVLIDAETGAEWASHAQPYRHGVIDRHLPNGRALPPGFALQDAADYLEAAQAVLAVIGRGRHVLGIGIDFTASSPLPTRNDGAPLSALRPDDPHAYVKLWKHGAAQLYAAAITARGGDYLANFGGKISGEWLLAKAAQMDAEAPDTWCAAERFIEAGDWLVWQLTGREVRSCDFAAYKAQFSLAAGYPNVVPGLASRLAYPSSVGTAAGALTPAWRERTGIDGPATVAVAVIDSHVVLPAVGAVTSGTLVGALGTSAAFLLLADQPRPVPFGIEGVAEGAALPDLWCYEAGQAGFGDTLAWYVRTFPRASDVAENFRLYNAEAATLKPGESHLLAIDWWGGNRVPFADSHLSGLIAGFTLQTSAAGLYRALLEGLSYGARSILDHMLAGGLAIDRVVLTSGLAESNPLLVQIMADVFGRDIVVPVCANPTALGAAIHGAVAAGIVPDFAAGARRFGAREGRTFAPDLGHAVVYDALYRHYRALCASDTVRATAPVLDAARAAASGPGRTPPDP